MAEALNLFPNRAAIGKTDATGAVYMTPEFSRALALLLIRIGGPTGGSTEDLALEIATSASAVGLHLEQTVEALEQQIAAASQTLAELAELRSHVGALALSSVVVPMPASAPAPEFEPQLVTAAHVAEVRDRLAAMELHFVTVPPAVDLSRLAKRSTTALAPVATDAATTMTLANNLRAQLLAAGIGT